MKTYHKIQTVFKRDPETNLKTVIVGDYATEEFHYLKDNIWTFTEKVDGTNIRIIFDGTDITFRGKSDKASIPQPLLEHLDFKYTPMRDVFADQFPDGVCLYGEGYGAKIQKGGGNYRPDQSFVMFDIKVGSWWLQRPVVEEIGTQFDIPVVPIIGTGNLGLMVSLVRDTELTSTWGDFKAEGIVAKPACELFARNGSRIITKLKVKDFQR